MSLTAEQLVERRLGLGASDASIAVGLSPWKTQFQLHLEKLGAAPALDRERELADALFIEMGQALEPVALSSFTRRTNLQVSDRQRKIVDPEWSRRWVTVDGLSSDGGLIEAKSTGFADPGEWGDELEEGAVPMHYLINTQHGLACSSLKHAWMPLIISNRQFRLYRITRDEELIQLLTQSEREFWKRVETLDPPPPKNLEDVRLRWPSHQLGRVEATAEIAQFLQEHSQLRALIKQSETRKAEVELLVKSHMGVASELVDAGNVLCTWKQAKPSQVFDVDQFALDHPALYSSYLHEKPGSRRFLNKL